MNEAIATHKAESSPGPNARKIKPLVEDLFAIKPWIYWLDLVASTLATYTCIWIYLTAAPWSWQQICAGAIAAGGFFRLATFMHEIVHFRKGHMRAFKIAWHIVAGIPLLTPSLFYTTHADHHSNRYYGTPADGEYLPFAITGRWPIIRFVLMIPVVPVLAVARALLLVPLSLVRPSFRDWLLEYASAAVISPTYRRRQVPGRWDRLWLVSDVACFAFTATVAGLIIAGAMPPTVIGKLYIIVLIAIGLNWTRTLAAHRYRNAGTEMPHGAQILDSITVDGGHTLTFWLYPVGLRYHALHHLLPSMPYHALGQAHRRLKATLPVDSPYHQTCVPSTIAALSALWRDATRDSDDAAGVLHRWRRALL